MRHVSFFLAALPIVAQAAPYQSVMNGEQFAAMLAKQPANQFEYRERDRAYAYLDGVRDATLGTIWCPTQPRKTHELAYDAADYMRGLHAELRKESAARLLLTYLSKQYPCGGKQ
jgi:hypothetical protein